MKYLKTIPVRMAAFPLLLMMATLLAASCVGGTRPFEDGRNYQVILEVILEEIVTLYEVAYTGEPEADGLAKDYVIRPSSEENELTVIRARIINHAAPRAQIDVEARPPELRTDTGRYYSLNTYEARVPTDGFHASKNAYVPFIRGSQELKKGSELEGWLVFDVPKESQVKSFKWETGGDIIIIDL